MSDSSKDHSMDDFYALKMGALWRHFKSEHFSFWMICCYIFFEYVRPQSIIPAIDILPWAQVFIILSAIGLLVAPGRKWVSNPANKWMILFYVVIVMSSMQAYWPEVSYKHLADFYTWLIIYFLIINIVNTEKRFFIFLLIIMVASFKISLFGARTWAMRGFSFTSWGMMGPAGYFQNSGELAIQMVVFSGMSWFFFIATKPYLTTVKKWLVGSFSVTAAMTVMASSSRGGQLALLAQIYQIFFRGKIGFRTILLVCVASGLLYVLLPDEQMARFEDIGTDRTSQQRLLYWEHGWDMMKDYPVLGVGYFNFAPYYEQHYPEDMLYENAQLPHNIFVQVGTDTGFVGLFIYIMLIFSVFSNGKKIRAICLERGAAGDFSAQISRGLEAGFIGFLVAGQFVTVAYYPFMWIQLALMTSLVNINEHTESV